MSYETRARYTRSVYTSSVIARHITLKTINPSRHDIYWSFGRVFFLARVLMQVFFRCVYVLSIEWQHWFLRKWMKIREVYEVV